MGGEEREKGGYEIRAKPEVITRVNGCNTRDASRA